MKKWISLLIMVVLCSCLTIPAYAADKPEKPDSPATAEEVEKYNQQVDEYNVTVKDEYGKKVQEIKEKNSSIQEYNDQVDKDYEVAVRETEQKNSEIEQSNEQAKNEYEQVVQETAAHNQEETAKVEASEQEIAEYNQAVAEIDEENQSRKEEYEQKVEEVNEANAAITKENEEKQQNYEQEKANIDVYNAEVDIVTNPERYNEPEIIYNSNLGDIQISNAGIVPYRQIIQTLDKKRGYRVYWNSMWLNEANTSYMRFLISGDITDSIASTKDNTEYFFNVKGQVYKYEDLNDPSTFTPTSELVNLIYSDGEYYLPEIVGIKSFVDLYFETWNYVNSWANVYKNAVSVHAGVVAEAIQTNNFYLDLLSDNPWGEEQAETGTETEKIKTIGDYVVTTPQNLSVLEGEKEALIELIPEELPATRDKIMPGDTITWNVNVNNISDYNLNVIYQIVYNTMLYPILENCFVTLLVDNSQIYQGAFIDTIFNLDNFVNSNMITMTVYIPTSLKNRWENTNIEYSLKFFAIPVLNYKDYPEVPEYQSLLPYPTVEYLSYPTMPKKYIPNYWEYPEPPSYKNLLSLPTKKPYKKFKSYPNKPKYLKHLKYVKPTVKKTTITYSETTPEIVYTEITYPEGEIIEDDPTPLGRYPLPHTGDYDISYLFIIMVISGLILIFTSRKTIFDK